MTVLDSLPDALVASDASGVVVMANRAALHLLGTAGSDLVGRASLESLVEDGGSHPDDGQWRPARLRCGGRNHPVQVSSIGLRDAQQVVQGRLWTLRRNDRAAIRGDEAMPIIDATVLGGLRRELGEDADAVIGDIIRAFTQDTAGQVLNLRTAATAKELARAAHRMRGSALNVGARRMAGLCAQAEAAATAGGADEARAFIDGICDELDHAIAALESRPR